MYWLCWGQLLLGCIPHRTGRSRTVWCVVCHCSCTSSQCGGLFHNQCTLTRMLGTLTALFGLGRSCHGLCLRNRSICPPLVGVPSWSGVSSVACRCFPALRLIVGWTVSMPISSQPPWLPRNAGLVPLSSPGWHPRGGRFVSLCPRGLCIVRLPHSLLSKLQCAHIHCMVS